MMHRRGTADDLGTRGFDCHRPLQKPLADRNKSPIREFAIAGIREKCLPLLQNRAKNFCELEAALSRLGVSEVFDWGRIGLRNDSISQGEVST